VLMMLITTFAACFHRSDAIDINLLASLHALGWRWLSVPVPPRTCDWITNVAAECIRSVSCVSDVSFFAWLNGLVVSALGIRTRGPRFDSPVAPLFHWVASLDKLFTHIASLQFLSSKNQNGVFGA